MLVECDRVVCSISHQLRIDGEDTWVKYEVNSAVQQAESAEQAATRVITHTNDSVMQAVQVAVETVKGHG